MRTKLSKQINLEVFNYYGIPTRCRKQIHFNDFKLNANCSIKIKNLTRSSHKKTRSD